MAFAHSSVYFDKGDSSILGCFREKTTDNLFEFSKNLDESKIPYLDAYPHLVWVTERSSFDYGYRYANVKKGVAYIVVNEDDDGNPIVEKWEIKQKRLYEALFN